MSSTGVPAGLKAEWSQCTGAWSLFPGAWARYHYKEVKEPVQPGSPGTGRVHCVPCYSGEEAKPQAQWAQTFRSKRNSLFPLISRNCFLKIKKSSQLDK